MCAFIFLFFLSFISCDDTIATSNSSNMPSLIIDVQPFSDIPEKSVKYICDELRKVYPNVEVKKSISLPSTAYYKPRNRHRADSIIAFLSRNAIANHVTIGLTTKDISTTKGAIVDYGIMGLAYQPGSAGVVSCFRLSKTNTLEQFFKITIHELGHTQGLPHCPVKGCIMQDKEGKNKTPEEKGFCEACKTYLTSKGWKL
jgi:archaemetzincin